MSFPRIVLACIAAFAFAGAESARAQSTSLFGSSGARANSSAIPRNSSTGYGSTTAGGSSTNTFSAAAQAGQAMATQGTAGGAAGGTGLQQNQQFGQVVNPTGGSGFVGRNANMGRFVGQQNAGQQTSRTTRRFQGVNNNTRTVTPTAQNLGTGGGGGLLGGSGQQQQVLRPVLRVSFPHATRTTATIRTNVQSHFSGVIALRPQFAGVNATVVGGGELVLRGTVASVDAKRLLGNLARLEPGVRTVRNELVVNSGGTAQ